MLFSEVSINTVVLVAASNNGNSKYRHFLTSFKDNQNKKNVFWITKVNGKTKKTM